MSFGLGNAGQTFQRFINGVLHDLDFCFAYIDDILVISANNAEHKQHLRILFQRLSDHCLLVNVSESCLGKKSVTFLGYQVSSEGTHPLPDRIADLQNFPVPKRLRGAQPVTWTSELDTAFSKCKEALSEVTLLTHPAPDVPLGLFMNASAHHVASALIQRVDALSNTSMCSKLNTAQFIQTTSLSPTLSFSTVKSYYLYNSINYRLLDSLQQTSSTSGAENVVADTFSHISYIAPPPVDLKAMD
ncbi:hypothetical protein TNCV_345281 [Trichonephila clavipes]|nr:hypothetical protein TNCV_345281 [Trichonephila clavipes]